MPRSNRIVLAAIAAVGAFLVVVLYYDQFAAPPPPLSAENAPALSAQPFHAQFISEETCLRCHAQERELAQFELTSPKIPHEFRKGCTSCHVLPASV